MAVAMLFPEDGGRGGRGKKTSQSVAGFGREFLRQARAVLAYSAPLAEAARDEAQGSPRTALSRFWRVTLPRRPRPVLARL
jgi:hypothetical protein